MLKLCLTSWSLQLLALSLQTAKIFSVVVAKRLLSFFLNFSVSKLLKIVPCIKMDFFLSVFSHLFSQILCALNLFVCFCIWVHLRPMQT